VGSAHGERTKHDLAGRSDRRVLPYGAWPSPVTVELAVGSSHGLSEPRPDGDSLNYLESRPEEAGRVALLRRAADGSVAELAPGLNVRTRVHEYGGGAHAVRDGVVVLSEFEGNRLLAADTPGAELRTLVDEPALRFADMELDLPRRRVIAVLEDQRESAARPRNLLCAVGLDDGSLVELAADHDFCSDPRISPDGGQLAWLTWDFPNMPWDGTDLWVAPLAGDGRLGDPVHAAGGAAESVAQPRWAPDGSLVFASDRTGWWNLHRWQGGPAEGRASVEPLAPMSAEFAGPQWVFGLSDFDIDDDGTIAAAANAAGGQRLVVLRPGQAPRFLALPFESLDGLRLRHGQLTLVAGSPVQPSAIIRVDVRSGAWERLVESRTLDIDAGFLSRPRHIAFPSADGRTAHAWYYPPTSAAAHGPAGELPPLVVMSHGGPTSQARTTLSLERQAFTSRGLGVVDVDYGGSTGYGRAYRELLHEAWGIVDVEDCVAAARHLVAQGLADARRLAIRGGSAGGYTTLAAMCFSDAFSAGVSYFGLGDLAGFAAITHKFESQYDRWLIGPADDGQRYRERSPNHHAARISCPVLVLQGADDRIVPPTQAEGIVAALRANGLPHAYLLFEGEGHGFRKAENQRRALEAELSFYAQVFGFELADAIEPLPIVGLPG
jgi:dipeptidyl aminopeptidase/acylaminoacyl peptidase